jgi:hypothetical protein
VTHISRIGSSTRLPRSAVILMAPIPTTGSLLYQEASELNAKLLLRLNDAVTFQLPRLRDCKVLPEQQLWGTELREEITGLARGAEVRYFCSFLEFIRSYLCFVGLSSTCGRFGARKRSFGSGFLGFGIDKAN